MIKGIYGINVAVKNLDEATQKYEAFFGIKARRVDSSFFAFPGLVGSQFNINGFHLNLIASLTDDTSVAKFVEKRGDGFFLLSVEVDDIEADMKRLQEAGAPAILAKTATGDFGAVNFIHPKAMAGVQVEVYQPAAATKELAPSGA